MRARLALALAAGSLALAAPAQAAGPPLIPESWVTEVTATGAKLRATINPNGFSTTYRFEYVSEAQFQESGFAGASQSPPTAPLSGTTSISVVRSIGGLTPATGYRYRPVATNSAGTTIGAEHILATQEVALVFELPDERGWEMVSPIDKGGGSVAAPGTLFGGGHLQGTPAGNAITYGSATAFGEAKGSPPASQYVSRRTASGWATENVSPAIASGAYGDDPDGAPYRAFSSDLGKGLLFGGLPCRGGFEGCPAPNPVLPGSGAPAGHMAYYLRDGANGEFDSLLSAADLAHTAVDPESFEISFAAASPDLAHVVLSSCAALTANATEVMVGPGECDPEEQNLYLWSASGLALLNLLPGDPEGTPGAEFAAPIGAISSDGSRAYWMQGGNLYVREGNQTLQVDGGVGGGGTFEAASADGSFAFFSKAGHLYGYPLAGVASDITPSGGVVGVLGASEDASRLYFQDAGGLKLWDDGTITTIAPGANAASAANFPPATGAARVTPDGEHLAFLSTQELVPYDNDDRGEAYLYGPPPGGGAPQLICASCNPTGERPLGSASLPGALVNGSSVAHRSRPLSANGSRLYFDTTDALLPFDTNNRPDVYQWEAQGVGDCTRSPGCVDLISSGRGLEGASFIDASQTGTDAYFLTDESLIEADPGSADLYDARANGGFAVPAKAIPCIADACQSLPAPPDDPTPGTLTPNAGNPAARIVREKSKADRCRKKKGKAKGRCLRRAEKQAKRGEARGAKHARGGRRQ